MNLPEKQMQSTFASRYAVSTVLSHFGSRDVVSTHMTIQAIRTMVPRCQETDEELVDLIISMATKRSTAIRFDHRSA